MITLTKCRSNWYQRLLQAPRGSCLGSLTSLISLSFNLNILQFCFLHTHTHTHVKDVIMHMLCPKNCELWFITRRFCLFFGDVVSLWDLQVKSLCWTSSKWPNHLDWGNEGIRESPVSCKVEKRSLFSCLFLTVEAHQVVWCVLPAWWCRSTGRRVIRGGSAFSSVFSMLMFWKCLVVPWRLQKPVNLEICKHKHFSQHY